MYSKNEFNELCKTKFENLDQNNQNEWEGNWGLVAMDSSDNHLTYRTHNDEIVKIYRTIKKYEEYLEVNFSGEHEIMRIIPVFEI
jgi:hypothetical protein